MKKLFLSVLLTFALATSAFAAAGSCEFSSSGDFKGFYQLTWVCTSASDGTVIAPTLTGANAGSQYSGRIDRVIFTPSSGTTQPSDSYDVKLHRVVCGAADTTDDLLSTLGIDLSQTNTKRDAPLTTTNGFVVRVFRDVLVPAAANVGDKKKFTLSILVDNR